MESSSLTLLASGLSTTMMAGSLKIDLRMLRYGFQVSSILQGLGNDLNFGYMGHVNESLEEYSKLDVSSDTFAMDVD